MQDCPHHGTLRTVALLRCRIPPIPGGVGGLGRGGGGGLSANVGLRAGTAFESFAVGGRRQGGGGGGFLGLFGRGIAPSSDSLESKAEHFFFPRVCGGVAWAGGCGVVVDAPTFSSLCTPPLPMVPHNS